jgi:asparagine synthase (glutamine-hydrolysing)
MIGRVPRSLRRGAAAAITNIPAQSWDAAWLKAGPLLPKDWRHRQPGYKLHKLAGLLGSRDLSSFYCGTTSQWLDPASVAVDAIEPPTALTDKDRWPHLKDFAHQIMYMDTVSYLPDDILTKVDRASMAVGLEARVPLLDHRVAEFAWTLPLSLKIRGGQGKWALRQVLHRYVPRQLVERPKSGFGVPLGAWLRGPLRDWAGSMLDSSRLRQEGYFHSEPIQQKWKEHLSGRREWEGQLWIILMFQAWLEETTKSTFATPRTLAASAQASRSALNV